jgi:hypothetical protein
MKSAHWPQEEAHPTSLDARFHGHDIIPALRLRSEQALAGSQEFA